MGAGEIVYNYRSSHDWIHQTGVQKTDRNSAEEQLLYHCLAFGISCEVAPSPPSPGPSSVSQACKKAINAACPDDRSVSDCTTCVHQHARTLIASGCPTGKGAPQACINYCHSRSLEPIVV